MSTELPNIPSGSLEEFFNYVKEHIHDEADEKEAARLAEEEKEKQNDPFSQFSISELLVQMAKRIMFIEETILSEGIKLEERLLAMEKSIEDLKKNYL